VRRSGSPDGYLATGDIVIVRIDAIADPTTHDASQAPHTVTNRQEDPA